MAPVSTVQRPSLEEWLERVKIRRFPQDREQAIQQFQESIAHYERKYGMATKDFILRYERGEFEMDDRYVA